MPRDEPSPVAAAGILSGLHDFAWRMVFRTGFPVARMWWRIWRPSHRGALVAIRVGPDLLLLRSSYRREWNFPGGGIRRGETPVQAATREVQEEIGLVGVALHAAGVISGIWDGRPDQVHFFELNLALPPRLRLDNREIVAARWTPLAELPGLALTGPVAAFLAGRPAGGEP
jgi:8-oxo-dGTP diphosphatase